MIPHVRIGDLFVLGIHDRLDIGIGDQNILAALDAMKKMNYPAASRGVSSSVLARHSVLDTESSRAFWIPASAGMTNSRQAAGNEPSWIQIRWTKDEEAETNGGP